MTSPFSPHARPLVLVVALLTASPFAWTAAAQTPTATAAQKSTATPKSREPGRPHSFEILFGAQVLTPQSLGTSTATMTPNQQSSPFTYFIVDGTRATAPAFRGRVGYNLTRLLTVEGGVVIGRSNVNGAVSADSEGATAPVLTESLTQYFIDVSLLAHLRSLAFSKGAGLPFVEGGGGYLRQVHQGSLAINTGQIYHFGGGITYMFSRRPTGRLTGVGFRADAQVYVPRKGYSFGGGQSPYAGIGGSLLVAF